jgi:L-rhamnose mutarotase
MLAALRDAGWRNYSLFLRDDGLLVGYVETDDFASAQRAMAARDINTRWQRDMAAKQETDTLHGMLQYAGRTEGCQIVLAENQGNVPSVPVFFPTQSLFRYFCSRKLPMNMASIPEE